jgi:hypothetical protein
LPRAAVGLRLAAAMSRPHAPVPRCTRRLVLALALLACCAPERAAQPSEAQPSEAQQRAAQQGATQPASTQPASQPASRAQSQPAGARSADAAELARAQELLAKLARTLEGVRVLNADYVQRQESLLALEPLVSRGQLWLRREPGCLLLEAHEPRRARIRMDGASHQVHDLEAGRAERFEFESRELSQALLQCFAVELAQLEAAFWVRGLEERGELRAIRLEPRSEKLRAHLRTLTLLVRAEPLQLAGFEQENAQGERLALEFAKLRLDPPLERADELFSAALPPGVRLSVHKVPQGKL